MLRSVVQKAIAKAKNDKESRLDPYWSNRTLFSMSFSMLMGLIRGFFRGLFFRSCKFPVIIKKRVIIRNPQFISVGKKFIAEEGCEINGLSRQGIRIGDRVTIGAYALIRPSSYYGGEPGEGLKIGDNSNIGPFSYVGCSGYIEIGDNVMMSPRVSLYAETHNYDRTDIPMKGQGVTRNSIRIENDCWIAANSVILAGVTISEGSIVAAGSVVYKDVPPYSIVAGVPAIVVRRRRPLSDDPAPNKE